MCRFIGICLTFASLLMAGCTPALQMEPGVVFEPQQIPLKAEQPDLFWWQLKFRLVWPDDEEPDFSRHLLIAEQLLLPVIVQYQPQLPLWRLHRRAGRGGAGHQFSLIFYSDRLTAAQISEQVESAPLSRWLIENEMIEEIRFVQRSPEELGRLELTSDPAWPIEIQRSWPYFIMGASQTWLMLVQELSAKNALAGTVDYNKLLLHYEEVNQRMNTLWRENGQHAYFHHLSALFGYQPLVIRTSELQTF